MEKQVLAQAHNFSPQSYDAFYLVADVGGNHTYIAIAGVRTNGDFEFIMRNTMFSSSIHDISAIINELLKEAHAIFKISINTACISAAGPVSRYRHYIKLTNIDLTVSTQEILDNTMLENVYIVNDFEAIGYGLDKLEFGKDYECISHVGQDLTRTDHKKGNYAVVGAGHGLGCSIARYDMQRKAHIPTPSEGGHIEFSAHDGFELDLIHYLQHNVMTKHTGHPEFERIVSGHGIAHIYNFLYDKGVFAKSKITKKIRKLKGQPKLFEISNHVDEAICQRTVQLFSQFYARIARNIALVGESYSGLFLAGGIANRYKDFIKSRDFMVEFEEHDKRSDVLRKTPVYIIENQDVGLFGCINIAHNFRDLMGE